MHRFISSLFVGLLCFFHSALSSEETSHVKAQLLQEGPLLENAPLSIAVHLDIDKGWHIYGKDPGEIGMPLTIEWEFPAGLTIGDLQWPTPQKFTVADFTGYGYAGKATLLSQLTFKESAKSYDSETITAHLKWLACSNETCQPGGTDVHLTLQSKATLAHDEVAMLFEEGRRQITPVTGVTSSLSPVQASSSFDEVGWAILFAFLGGILLNCMPCVLPVISLKIMSFVKMADESRALIFRHGLVFSLGVLLSFWLLASVMLLLRAYGQSVGWGFQLQDPSFVIALAALLFVFALSLFGVFEWGVSVSSWAGQTEAEQTKKAPGYLSSFLSGVLATAVATPCSGPFLGSAVGLAATLPVSLSLLVFTALALGLCFPYLLFSAFPACARFLPRPGAWMETFKHLMGFSLLATVLWLLWIFSAQTNSLSLILALAGFFCFSVGAWIYGKGASPLNRRLVRVVAYVCTLVFAVIGIELIRFPASTWTEPSNGGEIADAWEGWEEFSKERVADLRKSGKPLLIDFTAKWCLICQANHLVLSSQALKERFDDKGVVRMKADWTKNDPEITSELAKYGRNSVPLYVLYGADENKEPEILPQLLTPAIVSHHLDKAVPEKAVDETSGRKGITRDKRERATRDR